MRWLLVFMLLASPAAFAGDLDRGVTAMLYWERSLGAGSKLDSVSSFGFRLDGAHAVDRASIRPPLVDLRFNERGIRSLAFRGSVLHQNQPAPVTPAAEVNWWLVGGVAIGVAVVVRTESRKDPDSPESQAVRRRVIVSD